MLCKNCGHTLEEGATVCSNCGNPVSPSEEKIQITYEDEATEYVEPPVITESHTFIEEDDFAKKINDQFNTKVIFKNGEELVQDEYDMEEEEESKKSYLVWIFIVVLLIVIGVIFYFAILPNIMVSNKNNNNVTVDDKNTGFSSEEWTNKEFRIDGVLYKINQDYSNFANHGWSYSIDDEIKLEAGEKSDDTIRLSSSSYKDNSLVVGFYNSSVKTATVKDCKVYSVEVDNKDQDKPIDFELPGGIKMGSGALEITSIYGKLEEDSITYDEVGKYSVYHYTSGDLVLDLYIYDNGGLQKFHLEEN